MIKNINILNLGALVLLIIMISSCKDVEVKEKTLDQIYAGEWKTEFNKDISLALIKNNIKGCGEFKYKENVDYNREYAVHCTSDGENWRAYLVWVPINKVSGPYEPDERLK